MQPAPRQGSPMAAAPRARKQKKKRSGCFAVLRGLFFMVLIAAALVVGVPMGINAYVCGTTAGAMQSQDQMVSKAEAFDAQAILVLGAGINYDGSPSAILQDRLDTAIALYENGVAPKLIMSGDNSESSYNEVMAMCNYAIDQGVPARDIFCDHAGLSTYDSMYRLRHVFGAQRAVIVTQEYHLYRALYDARGFGIDVLGVSSTKRTYQNMDSYEKREFFARIKDFAGVLVKMEPETKSEPVSLDQSGTVTQWW